ncbi:two-component response regulator [Pseudanabaena sp. lw0831]|uniref:diguanylate cyclase domain-containing protein n=1 Tax=Pseudanabaena sp. lw0831 TaxID=1357935 RepID=UPI00191573DA|nr:diguanylate cyclase [Pseudanabaena sp. lw0831]GBO54912.1 two-component response regulator [Pseudanabaena sp. lw0831]
MIFQEIPDTPIQTSFLALPPSTSIKKAIGMMAEVRASCAIIIENQKLLGIFTERDVVRITTNSSLIETLTLAELMTKEVITLKLSDTKDIFTLSRLFSRNRIRHLPVLDEQNQVVGVVTPHSIRNLLKPEYLLRYVRVMEVMSQQVIYGLPSDSILVVAQQMAIHRVSCIVIVDPQTLFPIGILTERDVVKFHHLNLDFTQVPAQDVMSTPLSTMCPHDSLWSVHQRMQDLNVRRLVIKQPTGELAGIVTQTQMLKMLDPTEMYHVMAQMQEIIDRQTNELQQLNQRLQLANGELEKLSTMDELTQIENRRRFNEFLAHEWKRLEYLGKPLSLIMCDIDHFKSYNDTYGHLAGDECLVKIAKSLREATRQTSDLVARYGGEEFVVVLSNTNSDGAERVAQNILTQIQTLQIPHASSEIMGFVTISLGVATVIPKQSSSPAMLLQVADELLYQSKRQGRNTYNCKLIATNSSI